MIDNLEKDLFNMKDINVLLEEEVANFKKRL